MVETQRAKQSTGVVRVVVSNRGAADDLESHYTAMGARVTRDDVGGETYVVIDFGAA